MSGRSTCGWSSRLRSGSRPVSSSRSTSPIPEPAERSPDLTRSCPHQAPLRRFRCFSTWFLMDLGRPTSSDCEKGTTTSFAGPAGNFYLREDPTRDLLFVATGTGIAPFRSMLFANAERPVPSRTTLFWGLRSQRDLYYQDELARLSRDLPGNFAHHHAFTARTWLGWTLRKSDDVGRTRIYTM